MLKTTILFKTLALKAFKIGNNEVVRGVNSRIYKTVVDLSNKSKNYKLKNLTYVPNIKDFKKLIFPISNIKKVFNYLKQVLIKILIFCYFDLKYYIPIKINISNYTLIKIFN